MVVPRTTRLQFLVVRPTFWLSVHLEQGKWGRVSHLGHENSWLSVGQPRQYFWLSGDFFAGRTDNRIFERWPIPSYTRLIPK